MARGFLFFFKNQYVAAPLYRYCLHLCGSASDADDLFQDVWIRAIKHRDSYDANRSLENWLFTIATNLYRDRYRKAKRWLGRVKQYFNPELQQREMANIPGSADEPEDLLIASYRKELVRRALSRLKDEHRILLVLYYFEECTYREAAEILRIPEGTVKSRLNSAKKALKRERSDCPYDRYRGDGMVHGMDK
ncbi:sigma-70 family RNA polymerase sigma factor [Paenibacillus thiaminolyticus]|uniref:RNA polymerase sigma factor n=1 Tax=Paenibacillus thiaminolyticus TaxID=49283 RepID=UPI00116332EF|nr:sigma-70 family RNA polymerase sigma factor [Paenibacillus thiaminolyticus]NGP61139.1 sigma-70 family RNA polymerase sigma factor [Paenibacillus thiaminolyticus]WCR25292.1 sigma-70 family RNA polymerase sigma factor [Paenibacillus thiaminolyticus]